MSDPTRRAVLSGGIAALVASSAALAGDDEPAAGSIGAPTVGEAEKVAGIAYTTTEREQLARTIGADLVPLVAARRRFQPERALPPSLRFDPRIGALPPLQARLVRPKARAGAVPEGDDLAFAPVTSLARWLDDGALTSRRLVDASIDRLQRLDPKLLCAITPTPELARKQADAADASPKGHVLRGIPWGAKDVLDSAGIRTTDGSGLFTERVPAADAAVVARLHATGAVMVAKLACGELCNGDVWFGGQTRNPWLPAEGSSGSSAGPASAVAAGIVPFAVGSETWGSIVSPAMRCGIVGLRPTFGRVPRTGALPLCWSLDKLGVLARTVEDAAVVLQAIAGPDPGDPSTIDVPLDLELTRPVAGLRVGYDPKWFDAGIVADRIALDGLRRVGCTLVELALPDLPWDGLTLTLLAEAAAAWEDVTLGDLDDRFVDQGDDAWPNTFRLARFVSAVDLVQADRLRRRAMLALAERFASVDAMVGPSFGDMLLITNFTGHPSLTLRVGFRQIDAIRTDVGPPGAKLDPPVRVPHGITLWGRLFDEGTLCSLGMALERELDVWRERPTGL
jgi:Asp-tRNA(Asn)/Glu-tRNA(Gln) amidotransferase A subunit family amidase